MRSDMELEAPCLVSKVAEVEEASLCRFPETGSEQHHYPQPWHVKKIRFSSFIKRDVK